MRVSWLRLSTVSRTQDSNRLLSRKSWFYCISACQPVCRKCVLCVVCLYAITWLLSWVAGDTSWCIYRQYFFRPWEIKLIIYTAQTNAICLQRWTTFVVDNTFHFIVCLFFFSIRILVSLSYFKTRILKSPSVSQWKQADSGGAIFISCIFSVKGYLRFRFAHY